ncbi:flagellar filament capping protein FliD [Halomonas saccharevitans]|uniref:Flagellar hook-associated protein 2 n=1 Tax=Halomonas saccharevitans TaxID=416872 RepID=A0A1I6YYS3_9GAMM|nr:flagellar filament capping protein FliD [Halomonas saccharevitans]SFT55616.1 flagellar hook-associated protein 2 [Halomonas saccharevitans]
MASISSLGIGSGLDLNGLLDQLRSAEREKLQPLIVQKSQEESKISAYGRLQSGLDKFQDAVAALNDTSLFEGLSAKVQGDGLSATASAEASPGRYEVSVNRTATAGTLATTSAATQDEELFASASTLTLEFGATYDADGNFDDTAAAKSSLNIDIAAGSSLEDVRDAINANEEAGVDASIVNDGSGYRLALSSRETGAAASVVGLSFDSGPLNEDAVTLRPGHDAELGINGITITSPTNTVEGAIEGVTLELNPSSAGETLSLEVSRDTGGLKKAVNTLVSSYNELQSTIGRMTAYGGGEGASGELIGDRTVRNIESDMVRDLTGRVAGGEISVMSQFGVSLNEEGRLELDEDTFDEVAAADPEQLASFFAGADEAGGLAGRMEATLGRFLGEEGLIASAIEGSESQVESLSRRYTRMEASVERTVERYRAQFGQLDAMIANMNQTSSYLTQQFASLDAQLGRG